MRTIAAGGLAAVLLAGFASSASAQTGTVFGFGDSLLDTRNVCRLLPTFPATSKPFGTCSTGRGTLQWLPFVSNYSFRDANNYAVAGAGTGTFNVTAPLVGAAGIGTATEVDRFVSAGGRIAANDLLVISGAPNNRYLLFPPTSIPGTTLAAVALNDTANNIGRLIGAGARNLVVYGAGNDSRPTYQAVGSAVSPQDPVYGTAYNQGLPGALARFAAPGTQLRIFDYQQIYARATTTPSLYGFTSSTPCSVDPSCATNPAEYNKHFLWDIHPTEAGQLLLARYIANLIASTEGIPAQAEIGLSIGNAFSDSLFGRLDAYRGANAGLPVMAAYSADLPGGPRIAPMQVAIGSPLSVFLQGTYATGTRDARGFGPNGANVAAGFGYDLAGGTVGLEYRAMPGLLFGLAFNYANTEADLTGRRGRIGVDTFQGSGYASLNQRDWFADLVVTYGRNDYNLERPGIIDVLRASPGGDTLTAGFRSAYLFDFDVFRAGPYGGLRYTRTGIDAYTEAGDSVLTQFVQRQTVDVLTGSAGVQVRMPVLTLFEARVDSFVNVTAEHDFLGDSRYLVTANTFALGLPIFTPVGRYAERTYAKVAAGASVDLGAGFSAMINGSAALGDRREDYTATAGLRYRF